MSVKILTMTHPGRSLRQSVSIRVMVPDCFGKPMPLIDGETGRPIDFAQELGNPESWRKDRSGELEAIARRAGGVCQKLVGTR